MNTEPSSAPDPVVVRRNRRVIRIWLYTVCLLILAMIIVGGATRLTDSGLSITEWLPLLGAIPPLTEADWLAAFEKYKLIPEYTQLKHGMSLAEFKVIYWWEWAHRFLGRFIGVAFALPAIWFWLRGRIEPWLRPRLLLIFLLGAIQGGVGWWMVASGLVERTDVSQYRLATHLLLALIIFAAIVWVAAGMAERREILIRHKGFTTFWAAFLVLLVFVQIYLGGLVAGLDAGQTFNTWPLIDGDLIPRDIFDTNPWWLAAFEDIKTVQFNHRVGGYLLFFVALVQLFAIRRADLVAGFVSSRMLFLLILVQIGLGIATLLLGVPLWLGLVHQGVAVGVLFFALLHLRDLRGGYRIQK